MNRFWLALLPLGLVLAAIVPASAQETFVQGTFNLAEAYPCTVGAYDPAHGIAGPQRYCGTTTVPQTAGAHPGVLSLATAGVALDANCFAVIPPGQTGPCFVQSYRLTKIVPGSFKCPDVYGLPQGGYRYVQFGSGIRTWWSLNFTQPGTQFILDVVSVCRTPASGGGIGNPRVHRDIYTWRVVADVDTLRFTIELMHGGAISTLEVPCILGEDMYGVLIQAQQRLAQAISLAIDPEDSRTPRPARIANAISDMEALIVSNCLFIEVLNPLIAFPGPSQFGGPNFQPPGNLAQTVSLAQGSAVAGIIDTVENPCCCKLLVDLEWFAIRNGIVGPNTLPTF